MKRYSVLFNAITDAITDAIRALQDLQLALMVAQLSAENDFIAGED